MKFEHFDGTREQSEREMHEAAAFEEVSRTFGERTASIGERIKEKPIFASHEREYAIETPTDLLHARAQTEAACAREYLAEIHMENNYWQEKAAAKLADFYETKEDLITLYAEAKRYHPELAALLEAKNPYLADLHEAAAEEFEDIARD